MVNVSAENSGHSHESAISGDDRNDQISTLEGRTAILPYGDELGCLGASRLVVLM